jgi:GNAT superfamily N-acetyltransferase
VAFVVRAATPLDYPVFARLFPELGVADPLLTPEQFAARMLPRVWILDDDGEACGYAFHQVYGPTAHVVHVVVDPQARGRRGGAVLLDEVRRQALAEGCTRWYLNVKQTNTAAIRLYERCGLAVESQGWAVSTTWAALATLPACAEDVAVDVPRPEEDADVAARFDLTPERIAQLRARPGEVLLALRSGGSSLVAFAGFDPAFPGVYPVLLARVELARPLFDALRPHARAPHVNVFVERDRALFDRLAAVGAELQHATYRMGAPLG